MLLPWSMLWKFLVSFRWQTAKTPMLSFLPAGVCSTRFISLYPDVSAPEAVEKPPFLTCPVSFPHQAPPEAPDSWNLPPRLHEDFAIMREKQQCGWCCCGRKAGCILGILTPLTISPLIHDTSLTNTQALKHSDNLQTPVWFGDRGNFLVGNCAWGLCWMLSDTNLILNGLVCYCIPFRASLEACSSVERTQRGVFIKNNLWVIVPGRGLGPIRLNAVHLGNCFWSQIPALSPFPGESFPFTGCTGRGAPPHWI